MPQDWIIEPPAACRDELARALNISPIVAQVLANRGVTDIDEARGFLEPRLGDILPPEAIPATRPAADRIAGAVRDGESIVIFGDYDVDGITGVSILWHCLKLAGVEPGFYIPHRLEEGYGISTEAIDTLADEGAKLIVSVDCGVTAVESAARAKERGVDLIITDHHNPDVDASGAMRLPDTLIVHPGIGLEDEPPYPNRDLCGAGVAFKLAWAVAKTLSKTDKVTPEFRAFLMEALGLAALGTIADVVPLVGENRLIAFHGLKGLPQSRQPGIKALIHSAGLAGKKLDGYDIGFKLAPRLNAIGRMGHAQVAVEMLTRSTPAEAVRIAENLEQQNRARQSLQRKIAAQAKEMVVEQGQDADTVRAIVLASEGWHAGIIGIVASKIVEEFGRPTVLIALEGEQGQGSGRSIRHFPLGDVLAECREHLIAFGGHDMAAGLRIDASKVDAFREAFQARAGQRLTASDLTPKLHIDDIVDLGQLDEPLVENLGRLGPFGAGNPAPRLATEMLDVMGEPRTVGSPPNHLQVVLGNGRTQCNGIAFGQAKVRDQLLDCRRCRVAFRPILNEWNGRRNVEMQIKDFKFPDA